MDQKNIYIYIALLSAAVGDALPTVADYFYFKKQSDLKSQLESQQITPSQYWKKDAIAYYGYNSAYWLVIAGIVYSIKGDFAVKLKVAFTLVAAGAVFGIINKNIKKDEEFFATHQIVVK